MLTRYDSRESQFFSLSYFDTPALWVCMLLILFDRRQLHNLAFSHKYVHGSVCLSEVMLDWRVRLREDELVWLNHSVRYSVKSVISCVIAYPSFSPWCSHTCLTSNNWKWVFKSQTIFMLHFVYTVLCFTSLLTCLSVSPFHLVSSSRSHSLSVF